MTTLRRALFAAVFFAVMGFAQPLVTVQDTITKSGANWSGVVRISWPDFTDYRGVAVSKQTLFVPVNQGKFSTQLFVNANSVGGDLNLYSAVYVDLNGNIWKTEAWKVPQTAGPFTIAQVLSSTELNVSVATWYTSGPTQPRSCVKGDLWFDGSALKVCSSAGTPGTFSTISGNGGGGNTTFCQDATGSTTTYTCPTPTPAVTSLTGLMVVFKPQTTNTGASTLNVAGLGAKSLKEQDGSTNVTSGELVGGKAYIFQYDSVNFVMVGGAAGGTITGCQAGTTYQGTTCSVVSGNIITEVNPAITPGKNRNETVTGLWLLKQLQFGSGTLAAGPNALPDPTTVPDQWYWATDGTSRCATSGGGGSTRVLLQSDGTNWNAPNCTPSSGGQTLSTGMASCLAPDYPCYAYTGGGGPTPEPGALHVLVYKVPNPYTSQSIKQISTAAWTGTAKSSVAIYDQSGAAIQKSNTVTSAGSGGLPTTFTFSTSASVVQSWFYLGITWEATGTNFMIAPNSTVQGLFDAMTNEGMVYTAQNLAQQTGGVGTTITMPDNLGTLTRVTGPSAALPIVVKVTD